ncbi:unnamed protein product, partial [Prunus brigantina]
VAFYNCSLLGYMFACLFLLINLNVSLAARPFLQTQPSDMPNIPGMPALGSIVQPIATLIGNVTARIKFPPQQALQSTTSSNTNLVFTSNFNYHKHSKRCHSRGDFGTTSSANCIAIKSSLPPHNANYTWMEKSPLQYTIFNISPL